MFSDKVQQRSQRSYENRRRRIPQFLLTKTALVGVTICIATIVSVYVAFASTVIPTTTPYNQTFDGIGNPGVTPALSFLPADFRIDQPATVRTLGTFNAATTRTNNVAGANLASNATNGTYNFGSGATTFGGTDRAVGFLSSGAGTSSGDLYAELINTSGKELSALQISYNVEKYRNGSNPSGFRIQLYYSNNGQTWTSAGPQFLTSFPADADDNGFATVPGATIPVNKAIRVTIASQAKFYLAWNYSVTSGTNTTSAQALAIDSVSILGLFEAPTDPSGAGSASPNSVAQGDTTLLTVAVTPGDNPPSQNHTVTANLSSIGGNSAEAFFDDGSHGDVTPNDNIFSCNATIGSNTAPGLKTLPFTITEVGGVGRTGSGSILVTVLTPTNPSGVGVANPNSVLPGEPSALTVTVSPGTNPVSTNLAVTADLSVIGGSPTQQFFNDGVNGGDAIANDNVFTYTATVSESTPAGGKSLGFNVTDLQGRNGTGSIALTVQQPPPPADHVVISQIYGGGGDSNATFTNDYVELHNPTGVPFNLAGWSLQYASATGTTWSNKQPLGGIIAPGEYFLVALASGGNNGAPLPVSPNISGDINMNTSSGKVALVNNSISLSGGCPNGVDPDIVDFVGYGTSADCFEGAGHAPTPSATTAIFRKFSGSQDTNQNNSDFKSGIPNPRRTAPIMELGPWVSGTEPVSDGVNAPYDSTISIDFSEPVDVVGNWYDITCTASGKHSSATVAAYDNFRGYHITPNTSFQFGEQCTVTVSHDNVHDQDLDDSNPDTDTLFADHSWTFTIVGAGAPAPYPPSVHLTMGNPSNAAVDLLQPNNYLMEKPTYALSYNRDKGTPNWVSWHLEQDWFGSLPEVDTYRADPAVSPDWYRVQSSDYFSSGFDRGHMTPNADRDNQNRIPINQETYLMSNMVPQAPDNNQGPWADMENDLRTLLNGTQNEMYIVSGPLGIGGTGSNGGVTNTIANGNVTVPAFTWKVVLVLPKGENDISRVNAASRTIAVLMPNVQGIRNNDWHMYLTTVDNIEALTGYDFFPNVPDAIENAIEAGTDGNNPPGTENQFATIAEDVPGLITLNAVSSQANPTFTYTIVSGPAHGSLSGSGPGMTYTPNADYHGPDSFSFKVNDGSHDSNTSTVSITVTEVNDSPTANDDAASTDEDTPVNISAVDLTTNDSAGSADESLQTLTVTSVSSTVDTHGSVVLNSGIITYTPDANYHGPASFSYQVCDNGTSSGAPDFKCANATVNITVNSINDNPDAVDDSTSTDEDTPVTVDVAANDTDVDGDARTLQSVGTAAHGSVTIVAGQAQYSPNSNFHGTDTFTYVVSDGHGGTDTGTVNITVNPVNDAPSANSQAVSTNGNTAVGITLTGSDQETASSNLAFVITVNPAHGSLTGTGASRTYTPALNYSGPDSFKFTVTDTGDGSAAPVTSSEATVSITVNDTINPTVTAPANLNLGTGAGATSCSLFISDATLGTATANDNSGVVSIQRSGVPAGNIFPVGTTIITYTATDGAGNTAQATQTVVVTDNTAPTFNAPAPVTVNADSNGQGTIPNFAAVITAQDNCGGPVTITQNPVAGTTVGVGTHTVTITATDQAGNATSKTTTFTVQASGGLVFSLEVSPPQTKRGKTVKLKASYSNNTGAQQSVTFTFRYASPCGSFTIGNIGPIKITAGAHGNATIPLLIPHNACTGVYTLTLESYVGGQLIGTTTATLDVTR